MPLLVIGEVVMAHVTQWHYKQKGFFLKHLVNWDKMQVDGETMEYMVAIAIDLYEAKATLD